MTKLAASIFIALAAANAITGVFGHLPPPQHEVGK
jgi:hypothetical protein